jgi:lysozyme
MISNLKDQLLRDEGLRLQLYKDSRSIWTIGVGHNVEANPLPFDISHGISFVQAFQILDEDIARVSAKLFAALPWVRTLDLVRQGVFLNMSFNLGVGGLLEFHHDLADTQAGNYAQAAADMKASAWYSQVGERAQRLCQQMISGDWK